MPDDPPTPAEDDTEDSTAGGNDTVHREPTDEDPGEDTTTDSTDVTAETPGEEPADGADEPAPDTDSTTGDASKETRGPEPGVPEDVRTYDRFTKMDGAQYERVNDFLRNRTYITAREWAIARLCADFRTETGVEMTKIGENLPTLVPFMTDTYSPQAVNQARASFEEKVRKSGATFLYGAMSDFFSADELDEVMYEVTEIAKFLLEVEGVDLTVDEELEAEERISSVMRDVRHSSEELRHEGVACPNCGHEFEAHEGTTVGTENSPSAEQSVQTDSGSDDPAGPEDSNGDGSA